MLIYVAIITLLLYVIAFIISARLIPKSLSSSIFDINPKYTWIWTVVMYIVGLCCLPSYLDKTSVLQPIAFIAIAALLFIGAAPLIKDKKDLAYKVHMGAAYTCAVCSQLVLVFNKAYLLLLWFPFVLAFSIYYNRGKKWNTIAFWAEMTCFATTFVYCII